MKFALVGVGFISPRHINAIKSINGELLMTCDIDQRKNATFNSFDAMLRSNKFKEVNTVSICTPNYLHVQMIKKCLEHGKNVLCEKPLGLSMNEILSIPPTNSVKSVLQLRYHPQLAELKTDEIQNVELKVLVNRGKEYWTGWKGDIVKSGGILFNLGVHYFDILGFIYGTNYNVQQATIEEKLSTGIINFPNANVKFHIEIHEKPVNIRTLTIGGKEINFSDKDNLSYENLHIKVYEDLKLGKGVNVPEASNSIQMIENIKCWMKK